MVKVNNVDIDVFPNDTITTFKNRVAAKLSTLPRFLYFSNLPSLEDLQKFKKTIKAEILSEIIDPNSISFNEFYEAQKTRFPDVSIEEFIKLWLAQNKQIKEGVYKLFIEEDIKNYSKNFKIDEFLNRKDQFTKEISNLIKTNKDEVKDLDLVKKKLTTVKPRQSTSFIVDKILIEYDTDYKRLYLSDIFNLFTCSQNIPFISYKGFYKIYSHFIPPKFWNTTLNDIIIMKVPIKPYNITMEQEKYEESFADVFIYIQDEIVKIGINSIANKGGLVNEKKILSLITEAGFKFKILSSRENSVTGVFFIPSQALDKYVFADLVMNNNLFSKYFAIDESNKASKKKNAIFVYFKDPENPEYGSSTLTLTSKVVEKNDQDIKNEKRDLFPLGSSYLKVKVIRGKTIESINNINTTLSKLMTLYNTYKDDIVKFYREFIPTFDITEETVPSEKPAKKSLKNLVPELFLPNYTRICLHKPEIIDYNDFEPYKEEEFMFIDPDTETQVMLFPKSEDEGPQNYYICRDDEYKNPGIRINTLANKKEYPYVPCCYKTDQTVKKASDYSEYYHGVKTVAAVMQQRIITTNKFVGFSKFGYLPKNLSQLFESIDTNHEYLRKGVSNGINSFLECILEANDDILDVPEDERQNYLTDIRKNLKNSVGYASQNNPGISSEEIIKNLESETYFNPRKYKQLLERIFKVKIFIFTRDESNENASPLIPEFEGFILEKLSKNDDVVIVYEHLGNESDRATYPQCELIIRWKRKDPEDVDYGYKHDDKISQDITTIFNDYFSFNRLKSLYPHKGILLPEFKILDHTVDSYGKTRIIRSNIDNTEIIVYTNVQLPIKRAPISVKPFPVDNDLAMKFFVKNGITPYSFFNTPHNRELIGRDKYGIMYSVPVSGTKNFSLPRSEFSFSSINSGSEYEMFTRNKRIAKYILDIFIYMYSRYLSENDTELSEETLQEFAEKYVSEDVVSLTDITPYIDDIKLIKRQKLRVPIGTLNPLLYKTLIISKRNPDYILNYYKNKHINYYTSIDDYSSRENTITITQETPFDIFYQHNDYQLYSGIKLVIETPYITELNNKYFLVWPTKSMGDALFISEYYKTQKTLPDKIPETYPVPLSFTVYGFETTHQYKKYTVGGYEPELPSIGAYKRGGEYYYFALIGQ